MGALVLDARWLNTGLGTYTLNLIDELDKQPDIPFLLLTLPQYRDRLIRYNCKLEVVNVPIYSVREQFRVPWIARNSSLLHVPHYNAPLAHKGALLVTIHDLTHILDYTFRRSIKSWLYAQPMLRLVARRANHIFTVSEYSKRQIMGHLGIEAERITVVYNGIGRHIFPEPAELARSRTNRAFGFAGPYIIFVGNLKPSKNAEGLVKAFAVLKSKFRIPHTLLIIGDDAAGRPALVKLTGELSLKNSVASVPRVSENQIRFAYSGADLTVLPSFEEGFGLPVLESMACGTPVACSNRASIPEIAAAAAEYFNPDDIESIAGSIAAVLQSEGRRQELQRLGFQRARAFTREACASRHFHIYRRYLGIPEPHQIQTAAQQDDVS